MPDARPDPHALLESRLHSLPLLARAADGSLRDGLSLLDQVLVFGGGRVGEAVQPVINLLRDHLLGSLLIYGDETVVQVLKEKGKAAQSKSYMWAQMTHASGPDGTGPPIRLFAYSPSRSTQAAQLLYAGVREGSALITDGYEPYNAIASTHRLVHLGCWAH